MGGFTGFESTAGEEFPKAWAVIDHFHVVSLAFSKLDQCRRRTQRAITCWRDQAGDRLYQPAAPCALCLLYIGPTEAINGFLVHLHGIALGVCGLTRYIIRSLVHTGCLKDRLKQPPQLHDRPIYTPSNTKNQFKCLDIA